MKCELCHIQVVELRAGPDNPEVLLVDVAPNQISGYIVAIQGGFYFEAQTAEERKELRAADVPLHTAHRATCPCQ